MTKKAHGGPRPKVRPDDRRGGPRLKVRPDDARGGAQPNGGRQRNKSATVTTLQIGTDARDKLDIIVAQRRVVQPTATRRQIVEGMIAAAYAELDAMYMEAAEMMDN